MAKHVHQTSRRYTKLYLKRNLLHAMQKKMYWRFDEYCFHHRSVLPGKTSSHIRELKMRQRAGMTRPCERVKLGENRVGFVTTKAIKILNFIERQQLQHENCVNNCIDWKLANFYPMLYCIATTKGNSCVTFEI